MFDNDDMTLTSADELREITKSPEEIYNERKKGFCQNLCSSAASAAQRGEFKYGIPVTPNAFGSIETTDKLLNEVKTIFEELNYKVTLSKVEPNKLINETHNMITIDWSPSETSN